MANPHETRHETKHYWSDTASYLKENAGSALFVAIAVVTLMKLTSVAIEHLY